MGQCRHAAQTGTSDHLARVVVAVQRKGYPKSEGNETEPVLHSLPPKVLDPDFRIEIPPCTGNQTAIPELRAGSLSKALVPCLTHKLLVLPLELDV